MKLCQSKGNEHGDWREAAQFARSKNLTQEELGERTDLTKGYISQLERDLSSPSMETFFTILEVLGVTPEEFSRRKCAASSGLSRRRQHALL